MPPPNWRKNLERHGGFWRDGRWYDIHLDRRLPLALPMLDELVLALLAVAADKIGTLTPDYETLQATVSTDGDPLSHGPYDVVVASLALHAIIGHDVERAEAETRYELLFRSIRDALSPGGHLLVGDHVGTLDLYPQLKAMERAGFQAVDCAWRHDDFFVAGGRVGE